MRGERFGKLIVILVLPLLVLMAAGIALADEPMFWPADRQYPANDGSSPDDRAVLMDHDGDGDLDIIVYYDDGWYKWLENNGDGSYQTPVNLPDDFELPSDNEADLDGDGDIDYITCSYYRTSVYLNNGDGTYTRTDYSGARDFLLIDLDNDGDIDLITTGYYYNTPGSIYLNNGSGFFNLLSDPGFSGRMFVPADFDGDGNIDLVFTESNENNEDEVGIAFNNGDGTFTSAGTVELPAADDRQWGTQVNDLIIADFSGDGIPDVAVYTDNAEVTILIHDGSGGLSPSVQNYFGCASGLLSAGDVDNDGDIDLILVDPSSCGDLGVLKNNGDGTFAGVPRYLVTGNNNGEVISVAIADLNGDGLNDMAAGFSNYVIKTLINKGGREFEPGPVYEVNERPYDIAAVDLDGDGDMDLVTTAVDVLFNNGNGTFSEAVYYQVSNNGWYGGKKIHAADVDADGDMDIIHPDSIVLRNDGSGNFSAPEYNDNASYADAVADFNGDGYPDLASTKGIQVNWQYKSYLTISMNDGTGAYPDMVEIEWSSKRIKYIAAADVDNDGDIDIAGTLHTGGLKLSIMENDGNGNFSPSESYIIGEGNMDPYGMTAGDFNRDGYVDFAFINCYHMVVIALNNWDGTFSYGGAYSGICGANEVIKTADIDGDGSDDIVAVEDYPYSALHVLYNNTNIALRIQRLTESIIAAIDNMKENGITAEALAALQAELANLAEMISNAGDSGAVDKGPAQAMLVKALSASGGVASAEGSIGHKGNKAQAMLLTARQQLSGLLKVLTTVEKKM